MTGSEDERRSRFAVPLADLEHDAHVPAEDQVEEVAEPPAPDLIPEARRELEAFLKYGAAGG